MEQLDTNIKKGTCPTVFRKHATETMLRKYKTVCCFLSTIIPRNEINAVIIGFQAGHDFENEV